MLFFPVKIGKLLNQNWSWRQVANDSKRFAKVSGRILLMLWILHTGIWLLTSGSGCRPPDRIVSANLPVAKAPL